MICAAAPAMRTRRAWQLVLALGLLWALHAAMAALSGAALHVDEAQYWWWSRELQWGYFSKPPLTAALIQASTSLFGDGVAGIRALAQGLWVLCVGVVWLLGRDLDTPEAGLWSAAVFACSPLFNLGGLVATTDAPLMLCWVLSMWLCWHLSQRPRLLTAAALGLTLGLGLLSKYAMLALLPGLALWLVWQQGRRGLRAFMLAALVAGVVLWPHAHWNVEHAWPTWRHVVDSSDASSAKGMAAVNRLLLFTLAQALLFAPLLTLAAGMIVLSRRFYPAAGADAGHAYGKPPRSAAWCFLAASCGPMVLAGLLQSLRGRAEVNWIAPAHLGLALAVGLWMRWRLHREPPARGWRSLSISVLVIQALLCALLAGLPAAWQRLQPGGYPPAALDAWARMRGWDEAFEQLRRVAAAHPGTHFLSDSRQVLAHGAYAWRDLRIRPAGVDEPGRARHHFSFACPVEQALSSPGPYLVVTEGPPSELVKSRLGPLVLLAKVAAPRSNGRQVELQAWQGRWDADPVSGATPC